MQSAVLFGGVSGESVLTFIETGHFTKAVEKQEAISYTPAVLANLQKQMDEERERTK
jgi:hypothetical protein